MKTKPEFPMSYVHLGVPFKIYRTPSKGCDGYTLAYRLGSARKREFHSELVDAKEAAKIAAVKVINGTGSVLELSVTDRQSAANAMATLKPSGLSLETVATQYMEAWKILGGGSLIEAAKFYQSKHAAGLPRRTVSEVVEELLEDRRHNRVSEGQMEQLELRLRKFASAFQCQINDVQPSQIKDFLNNLKGLGDRPMKSRTKNNFRQIIGQLFNFAKFQRYVPDDFDSIKRVPEFRETPGDISIFTPEQVSALLTHSWPEILPMVAIGAFAGLRHAEIGRLDWSEINLADNLIEVKAMKSKTASRRVVPILPNLSEWLRPIAKTSGPVCSKFNMSDYFRTLGKNAGVAWRKNALRHSFISYRVAQIQNVNQVALEAGNSAQVIFKNYRELVRPADAAKWFSVAPSKVSNVVALANA